MDWDSIREEIRVATDGFFTRDNAPIAYCDEVARIAAERRARRNA